MTGVVTHTCMYMYVYVHEHGLHEDVHNVCRLPNRIRNLDFNDTFLSFDHVKTSFPQYTVKVSVIICMYIFNFSWLISSALQKTSVNKSHHSS